MWVFPWLKTLAYCLSMSIMTISYQKVVTKRKRIVNVKSIVSNFISGFILCWSSVIFSSINYILGVRVIETNSPQNICSGPTRIACMLWWIDFSITIIIQWLWLNLSKIFIFEVSLLWPFIFSWQEIYRANKKIRCSLLVILR